MIQNGSDEYKIYKNLPQPFNYLYYMRMRDKKMIQNGSDKHKSKEHLPQPFNYLYYISLRG
jgi:hypothetical protein